MTTRLHFLGATGTVTGSRFLLEACGRRLLIDCGLFQGWKQLRLRNREPFPVAPESIDAVVLTHAHLDHSGWLPALVSQGFRGPIHCTGATLDLCRVLLPDSARLLEEEAAYANRHRFSKHRPALPLYTLADAMACLKSLRGHRWGVEVALDEDPRSPRAQKHEVSVRFHLAGHILGAAIAEIRCGSHRIVFSGDLGRYVDPIMKAPVQPGAADWLVVESTYGNRLHDPQDPAEKIAEVIRRVCARGGVLIVPTFAVGRAQQLLHLISRLKHSRAIPPVPVYLNSPMAVDATRLWLRHRDEHRLSASDCAALHDAARIVNSPQESRELNARKGPMVILAGSGMATGGRVLHHLKAFGPDSRNAILLTGYQAGGTRGAALAAGAPFLRIHGEDVPIRAEVHQVALSAHADAGEIERWLRGFPAPPQRTFVVHGEPDAADALRYRIEHRLGWDVVVPDYRQVVELGTGGCEAAAAAD